MSDEYTNNNTKLCFLCECGKEYNATWTHFQQGNNWKCPDCSFRESCSTRLSVDDVKNRVINAGFVPLFDTYNNISQKLKIMNKDGYILETLLSNINNIKGNDIVTPTNSYSIVNIEKFIKDNNYTCELLSKDYKNKNTKLKLKCQCGNVFYTTWNNLRNQHVYRCGKCSGAQSFYELKTEEWLTENNYKYKTEVKLDGCRYKRQLSFDFQVFITDDLYCLIEVDGDFHHRPQYSTEGFYKQKERDKVKDMFCKKNNIPLLRINYWRFREPYSYKNILQEFLDSLQQ